MITSLTMLKDWRCFYAGQRFAFSPKITTLIGDQGAGKSALIALIAALTGGNKQIAKPNEIARLNQGIDSSGFAWYDSARHNPRVKTNVENTGDVVCRFLSHGQVQLSVVLGHLEDCVKVLFLDEPECGLSTKSQTKIAEAMHKACVSGTQIIVATHSSIIAQASDILIDLDQ